MGITRLRQRTAIQLFLQNISGIDSVYPQGEPYVDDPLLLGKVYAVIDMLTGVEKRLAGPSIGGYKQQNRTWTLHVVQRNDPVAIEDVAARSLLEARFDIVKDNIEAALRLSSSLKDNTGKVIDKFGEEFETQEGVSEYSMFRTVQEALFLVRGYVIQT